MRRVAIQSRAELALVLRNGEQLLLTIVIPLLLLVFFGLVDVLPTGDGDPVDFLVPGVLAVAIMSAAMVSMGIATGFERSYLVLKRLGATPLTRGELVTAKIVTVFVVEVIQAVLLVGVALSLGWRPAGSLVPLALAAIALGTSAFAGIGLTLAGTLRAEINLAAQNGLYIVLLLLGGMIISHDSLPSALADAASWLPSSALADLLRAALNGEGAVAAPAGVLGAWALLAPVVAARRFRWS